MKKSIFYIAVIIAQVIIASANANNRPDLEFRDVYDDYISSKNISNYFSKFSVGDTLELKSSYCVVEYVIPDTIWKKRVKKPKENKHYILQYKWKGVPTAEKAKNGFYEYRQSTYAVNGKYIYLGYDDADTYKKWIIVKDPAASRDLRVAISDIYVKSPKLTREILSRLTSDTIFYIHGFGNTEDNYRILKVKNVDYKVRITISGYTGAISVKADEDDVKFNNGKLEIRSGKIISSTEYHNFFDKINNDKKFLSLVVIRDGIPVGMEYMFHLDTMALYRMEKVRAESFSNPENVYYCYAYGQSYQFWGKPYSRDCVEMLSPEDSTYLLSQKYSGENYRLENAQKWDEKNQWLRNKDEQWDNDSCILATIVGDCQLVDKYGIIMYDYAEKPLKGEKVPVICYCHDLDSLSSYRFFYKGEYFAIKKDDLKFKSEEESAYLGRRGLQGSDSRAINAISHDIARAFAENLEAEMKKYENYDKKQIFLLGQETYDSGYGWEGLKFKFYNCFKKTIKYINCRITAYNYFGDEQCDRNGRSTYDIRCIGPIYRGEGGSFEFDDCFNNKSEVISSYRVTKIIFTFIDNTTVTYSGWNKIKPHTDL